MFDPPAFVFFPSAEACGVTLGVLDGVDGCCTFALEVGTGAREIAIGCREPF